jgi:hypothetical protein
MSFSYIFPAKDPLELYSAENLDFVSAEQRRYVDQTSEVKSPMRTITIDF